MGGWGRGLAAALAAGVVIAGGCTVSDDGGDEATGARARDEGSPAVVELAPLSVARTGRPRIVDAHGREVLLRGANLNSLGDYHQDDPDLPPTHPPTDADWEAMAANGFSVVRLVVSWSALEPERGTLDEGYVDRIRAAVDEAADRGIYTVVDFHQDAYSRFVATPDGMTCPSGTEPAIGWDGAPEWATLTDGESTCRPPGLREGAPAVQAAFRNFYANTDGIRDAFVATVARLAGELADEPAVAGYDLLNEPNVVLPPDESSARYTELVSDLVTAVRAAEVGAGGFPHLLFLEPMVLFPLPGTLPAEGFTDDRDIVFAPHNYAESIGPRILTVEQTADIDAATATERGWPLWIGEFGVFDTTPAKLDVLRRFAVTQDMSFAGGAAWQWRQHCGEPHSVTHPGNVVDGRIVQLNVVDCPGDRDGGPNEDFLAVIGRSYPRAAPGQLTELRSDPTSGALTVAGTATGDDRDGELVVWVRGGVRPHSVTADGVTVPDITPVEGGAYVTARPTAGEYRLEIAGR